MAETLGFDVTITFSPGSIYGRHGCIQETLHNVTEIHYCIPDALTPKIAFESDVHGTGFVYDRADIAEFEALPASCKAEGI